MSHNESDPAAVIAYAVLVFGIIFMAAIFFIGKALVVEPTTCQTRGAEVAWVDHDNHYCVKDGKVVR